MSTDTTTRWTVTVIRARAANVSANELQPVVDGACDDARAENSTRD